MDASIMEGTGLRAGGVANLEHIRNPIVAARLVMEKTDHVLVVGQQAKPPRKTFRIVAKFFQ